MNLEQGKKLIELARKSISNQLKGKDTEAVKELQKEFSTKQGVFVTLKKQGELRGCIGFPEPIMALWRAVVEASQSAAFSDPRFNPITEEEFKEISIEVSVLTKPELIKVESADEYPSKVHIGEDGLIIRSSYGSGLLLPQVFIEHKCSSPEEALKMTCQKAGIDSYAWKEEGIEIYTFQAQIFSEEGDEVVEKKQSLDG